MVKSLSTVTISVLAVKYPNVILDHKAVKPRVNIQRLFPERGCNIKIRVEIPNNYNIRSTAQSQMEWAKIP